MATAEGSACKKIHTEVSCYCVLWPLCEGEAPCRYIRRSTVETFKTNETRWKEKPASYVAQFVSIKVPWFLLETAVNIYVRVPVVSVLCHYRQPWL